MSNTIIHFFGHHHGGKARGKQPTSIPNTLPQGSAKSTSSRGGGVDMPPQSGATSNIEVNIKLTLETIDAR